MSNLLGEVVLRPSSPPSSVPSTKFMSRKHHLLNKFGITEEQYESLLLRQGRCCAICRRTFRAFKKRLAVDHDHHTGEIRGLLCDYCNRRIVGRHRKDLGLEYLRSAVAYLDREYTGWIVPPKKKKRRKRNGTKRKSIR